MVHNVTIQDRDGTPAVSIPKDIMEFAGLVDDDGDCMTDGGVFMQYDPSTRVVSFTLPEAADLDDRRDRLDAAQTSLEGVDS